MEIFKTYLSIDWPGVGAHAFNPSSQVAEAGESLRVQGHPVYRKQTQENRSYLPAFP